jgi:hypothetical protein
MKDFGIPNRIGAIVQPILKTLPERGTTYSFSTRGNG